MKNVLDAIFVRDKQHVCPWWLCFTFDNVFRRIFHDPEKILSPYVNEGETAVDIGAGMGYFSIPLARLVGSGGSVIAVDTQERMLKAVHSRARKAGLDERIIAHLTTGDTIGITRKVDFVLAFWMVHEVTDRRRFLGEIRAMLKPDGLFLLVEPAMHVTRKTFEEMTLSAIEAGFVVQGSPRISLSQSLLLKPLVR